MENARQETAMRSLRVLSFPIALLLAGAAPAFPQSSWVQSNKITPTATSTSTQQKFGASLASFGDWLLAGSFEQGGTGSAYLFERQGSAWGETYEFYPDAMLPDDEFGRAVALGQGVAVVGAPSAYDSGAAYVYEGAGSIWSEAACFLLQPLQQGALLGWSVAVSGDVALIGAPGISKVFALERSSGIWSWKGELVPSGFVPAEFGYSIAIEGTTAVVGSSGDGSVRVFDRSSGVWSETAELVSGDLDLERFGASVSIRGGGILVGAPEEDGDGAAVLFVLGASGWSQTAEWRSATVLPSSEFGFAVVLGADIAVVGAPGDEDSGVLGSAHVFERRSSSWVETAQLDPDVGPGEGTFGSSVALVDQNVLVNIGLNDSGVIGYLGAINVWGKTGGPSGKTAFLSGSFPRKRQ